MLIGQTNCLRNRAYTTTLKYGIISCDKDYNEGTATIGFDFKTHPIGKFHQIDKSRNGIIQKLEHLMNSNKEQFHFFVQLGTINVYSKTEKFSLRSLPFIPNGS